MPVRHAPAGTAVAARTALVAAALVLPACATLVGGVPRMEPLDPAAGFKMLHPEASVTVCRARGWLSGRQGGETATGTTASDDDLVDAALRDLLARDEEATTVLNARLISRSWSLGVYGKQCLTLTGDVVRAVTTLVLPMEGMHDGHHVHETH